MPDHPRSRNEPSRRRQRRIRYVIDLRGCCCLHPLKSIIQALSVSHFNGRDRGLVVRVYSSVVILHRGIFADFIHNFHPFRHMAESGIVPIQKQAVLMDDKELGGSAVRVAGSCHGDNAPFVGNIILHAVFRKFPFDIFIGTAGSIAQRIAALDHKTADDPVEGQAVVKAFIVCILQRYITIRRAGIKGI